MGKKALITDKWYINRRGIIAQQCCFAFVEVRFIASNRVGAFSGISLLQGMFLDAMNRVSTRSRVRLTYGLFCLF